MEVDDDGVVVFHIQTKYRRNFNDFTHVSGVARHFSGFNTDIRRHQLTAVIQNGSRQAGSSCFAHSRLDRDAEG
jgi:hypothetical protein